MPCQVVALAVIATMGAHGAGVCLGDCCDDPVGARSC